jgi:D-glycero-D-manno-heptose 1,7-bisphosphate phosphatase
MAKQREMDFSNVNTVFIDRDGVINRKAPNGAFVTSWDEFEMLPGVEPAIASLNRTQRAVIVVTNQRAIALGRMSELELIAIHEKLKARLEGYGARLDSIYYCPHDVGECSCRKPATGLFDRAFREFPGACPENSVMIGDSYSDMLAGARMGMRTIFIAEGSNSDSCSLELADASANSLAEAVQAYLL